MIVGGFSASLPPSMAHTRIPSITLKNTCPIPPWVSSVVIPRLLLENNRISSPSLKVKPARFGGILSSMSFRCNSITGPGGHGEDAASRNVLDAFFLGKALAETVNDRVESAVWEFFSALGRLQAEQQKQVQDFQEDVLKRAKTAKEKAAWEAMEAQRPTTGVKIVSDGDTTTNIPSATVAAISAISPPSSSSSTTNVDSSKDTDPSIVGLSDED